MIDFSKIDVSLMMKASTIEFSDLSKEKEKEMIYSVIEKHVDCEFDNYMTIHGFTKSVLSKGEKVISKERYERYKNIKEPNIIDFKTIHSVLFKHISFDFDVDIVRKMIHKPINSALVSIPLGKE